MGILAWTLLRDCRQNCEILTEDKSILRAQIAQLVRVLTTAPAFAQRMIAALILRELSKVLSISDDGASVMNYWPTSTKDRRRQQFADILEDVHGPIAEWLEVLVAKLSSPEYLISQSLSV